MKSLLILFLNFVIFGFFNICCKKQHSNSSKSEIAEKLSRSLPVSISVLRDGKSKVIVYPLNSNQPLTKLYLVFKQHPDEGGDIYLNENWDSPGARPLSEDQALMRLNQVEELLKKYHGESRFEEITKNSERFNSMSVDELEQKFKDPLFVEQFDTCSVMTSLQLFRGFVKRK